MCSSMCILSNNECLKYLNYHHASNPTEHKSVWTVEDAFNVEKNLVEEIIKKKYLSTPSEKMVGYNVVNENNRLKILGKDNHSKKLKISKFIRENASWHGYPANHINKPQDKPGAEILKKLNKDSKIDAKDRRRIGRGQPI